MNTNDKDFKENQEEIKTHHPQKECDCDLCNGQDVNTIHKDFKANCKENYGEIKILHVRPSKIMLM
jgi:hypothetical protein